MEEEDAARDARKVPEMNADVMVAQRIWERTVRGRAFSFSGETKVKD